MTLAKNKVSFESDTNVSEILDKLNLKFPWLTIIKWVQGVLTIITSLITIIINTLDEDTGQMLKDKCLLPLQITSLVLVVLFALVWYVIIPIIKKRKYLKFKLKYGIDIHKLDTFYEENKEKKLSECLDLMLSWAKDKYAKEPTKELKERIDAIETIQKEGVI